MPTTKPIRVMVVDDHDMVRMSLRILIDSLPHLEWAGEAINGSQCLERYAVYQPDVVLMDILMPGMDGLEATRHICQHDPHAQIVALASYIEEGMAQAVLEAGAAAYLLKSVTSETLVDTIVAAYARRNGC